MSSEYLKKLENILEGVENLCESDELKVDAAKNSFSSALNKLEKLAEKNLLGGEGMKLIYVVKVGNLFYKDRYVNKSFVVTGDIQDAKWFYTKETAAIVAKELSGEVREVIFAL